ALFGPGFPSGLNIPAQAQELAGAEVEAPPRFVAAVALAAVGNVLVVGGGDEAALAAEDAPDEGLALVRFLMGLSEALQGEEPAAPSGWQAAVDAVFGQWWAPLAGALPGGGQALLAAGLDA